MGHCSGGRRGAWGRAVWTRCPTDVPSLRPSQRTASPGAQCRRWAASGMAAGARSLSRRVLPSSGAAQRVGAARCSRGAKLHQQECGVHGDRGGGRPHLPGPGRTPAEGRVPSQLLLSGVQGLVPCSLSAATESLGCRRTPSSRQSPALNPSHLSCYGEGRCKRSPEARAWGSTSSWSPACCSGPRSLR